MSYPLRHVSLKYLKKMFRNSLLVTKLKNHLFLIVYTAENIYQYKVRSFQYLKVRIN